MDYISRLELDTVTCHIYNNNTLSLSNDELAKILHNDDRSLDKLNIQFNTHDNIRRAVADALVFIHTVCKESKHEDLLLINFETWNDFFDTCFADIICNSTDHNLRRLACRLQRQVDEYNMYYGTYTPFEVSIVNTTTFFKQLAVAIFISLLMPL